MKPNIYTRREKILGLPDYWRQVYVCGGDPQDARATWARLKALDLKTATREEVEAAIDVNWATKGRYYTEMICDGCGQDVEALVAVGRDPDENDGRGNADLCGNCIAEAAKAFEGE